MITPTKDIHFSTDSPHNDSIEVSLVMPCLNEAETLEVCITKAWQGLREQNVAGEIVVADNGSSDGSPEIATRLGARVAYVPEAGYGNALMGGIEAARGQYVIIGDADDSYDWSKLELFIKALREGNDLVMGNRFKGGIEPGAMKPLHRYLGNPVLTGIGRLFFHSPCGDFHCGLRGFNKASLEQLNLRTAGMEFASEMVVKATLAGLKITEVPTKLWPDGRGRPPHLRSWRDGWRHLRFLLLFSPRWLFLYPGALLMLIGLVSSLWLIAGPRHIGNITLDVQTLLYASMSIVVGFQAIIFALFTKIFAISEGLLPEDPRLNSWFRFVTLETGLLVGLALLLGGTAGTVQALNFWSGQAYGVLNPSQTLRWVIPSITALTLGCQVILSSFFLSILGLRRR